MCVRHLIQGASRHGRKGSALRILNDGFAPAGAGHHQSCCAVAPAYWSKSRQSPGGHRRQPRSETEGRWLDGADFRAAPAARRIWGYMRPEWSAVWERPGVQPPLHEALRSISVVKPATRRPRPHHDDISMSNCFQLPLCVPATSLC
jgi:hypothetical protein